MDEVFLVGEVVVELALADVRGGADVVEGGACDAVLEDELSGRVEHAISRGAALVGTRFGAVIPEDSSIWTGRSILAMLHVMDRRVQIHFTSTRTDDRSGRTVLVTGGTSGIGEAIARAYAAEARMW